MGNSTRSRLHLVWALSSTLGACTLGPTVDVPVEDANSSYGDAGSVADGGAATPDADANPLDGGTSAPDGGTPEADAGTSSPDAGASPVDSGATEPDAAVAAPDAGVVVAPSGTWIAFTAIVSRKHDVFVSRPDGSERRQITSTTVHEYYPSWTPDGAAVVVARQDAATGLLSLVEIDVNTLEARPIVTGLENATSPAVSPDGTEIAFEGRAAGGTWPDIYVVARAGGVAMRITADVARDAAPCWSADGASIYFASNRGGTFEVWEARRDGSEPRAITAGTNLLGRPAVSDDGRWLAVTTAARIVPSVVRLYDLADLSWVEVPCDAGLSSPAFSRDSSTLFGVYQSGVRTDVASFDVATLSGPAFVSDDPLVEASPASL